MKATVLINGGVGNKLFQIAMLMGLQKKYPHAEIVIDVNKYYNKAHHERVDWKYFIRGLEGVFEKSSSTLTYEEGYYNCGKYTELNFDVSVTSVFLVGCFLSERYFESIRPSILSQFGPTDQAISYLFEKYPDLSSGYFVHIRRGDFLNDPLHDLHLFENGYYDRAIQHFANIPSKKMFVCSNDLAWCKQQSMFVDSILVDEDEILTLWLMSLCKFGGIAANSTYSWWGLYLNKSQEKIAIVPNKLITNSAMITTDYYPANYTIVSVT